ncbi:MAG: helix-hairpin-helix domain-containing protein [Oscillospiraceae bacterium]|nr:helix-hairpin-helix domain-containing protein [Oscillospiraceae bacterium]
MKQSIAYRILLAVTIAVTTLMLLMTFVFRENFPVSVRYDFPRAYDETGDGFFEEDGIAREWAAAGGEVWLPYYTEHELEEIWVYFPLDLNEAAYGELILIPRVGDVTAQRIIQYRDYLGGYEKLEQLMDIRGIGEGIFAQIAPYLYVD